MKLIKIISGTYGLRTKGAAFVDPKTTASKPFAVDDKEAERLVKLGVASIVMDGVPDPDDFATLKDVEKDPVPNVTPTSGSFKPSYSVDSKAQELRDIGKDIGITFPVGTSKAEMVKQLDEYYSAEEEEDDDGLTLTPLDPSL